MGQSLSFIKERAVKSIAAAREVAAKWTWQEMTVEQYSDRLALIIGDHDATPAVEGQEGKVSAAYGAVLAQRSTWDVNLDQLHRWTVQGLGMARNRFRDEPTKLRQLAGLSAEGEGRPEILREALEWESAWEKLDAAWAPLPANTLAAFSALRKNCLEPLQDAYADSRADWRQEAEKLNQLAAALNDLNVAWYADATRVFPAGTPEGDMIRGTVPTTYRPPPSPPPPGP